MQKIKLNRIWENHPKKGVHTVCLDHEHKWEFTQRKKADEFLVKVSNYLTRGLEILNSKYIEAFTIYRRIIFAIDHPFMRVSIQRSVDGINKQFDWILDQTNWEITSDRQGAIFPKMNLIYESIYSMLSQIRTVADRRNEIILKHEIDGLITQLEIFSREYEKFHLELRNWQECKVIKLEIA